MRFRLKALFVVLILFALVIGFVEWVKVISAVKRSEEFRGPGNIINEPPVSEQN